MRLFHMLLMLVLQQHLRGIWEGLVELNPSLSELTSGHTNKLDSLGPGGLGTVYSAYGSLKNLILSPQINLSSRSEGDKIDRFAIKVTQDSLSDKVAKMDFTKEARTMFYVYMATHGRISPKIIRSGSTKEDKGFIIMEILGADLKGHRSSQVRRT